MPYRASNGLRAGQCVRKPAGVTSGCALTPMAKAPPKSLRITQGHGSREWSIVCLRQLWAVSPDAGPDDADRRCWPMLLVG